MTTIIAEIGINHNGSVRLAKQLMDMAKECGAHLVKFQKRTIEEVYTTDELAKARESPWGTTQGQQKHGLEFGLDEYREINKYAHNLDLPWFASAWDLKSLEFLDQFQLEHNKVASAMITNCEFLEAVATRKKFTYISTGLLSDFKPIDKAVAIFRYHDCPFALMHCVGDYPCAPKNTNLALIPVLQQRYPDTAIGFSSHAVSPVIGSLAVLMGAVAVEAHITLDRSMYGSDQAASLEKPGLEKLVDYCNLAETAKGDGIKVMTPTETKNAKKLRYWENR